MSVLRAVDDDVGPKSVDRQRGVEAGVQTGQRGGREDVDGGAVGEMGRAGTDSVGDAAVIAGRGDEA
ncbi:unannotated protein [freshwater metagenome]|uniref:Unannotated protein n=1 Tax=freshwater metagenome TaxID=449393 RepID=A0A6J7FTD6_9ZZZZ